MTRKQIFYFFFLFDEYIFLFLVKSESSIFVEGYRNVILTGPLIK